jgi:predicted HTH domain antitoxin
MQLSIPEDAIADPSLTEEVLLRELAVALYRQGRITVGHGSKMTRLSEIEFQRLLDDAGLDLRYPAETLDQDLATLNTGL